MRKTSVVLLSAATGAALTLLATQPRAIFMGSTARAATSDTYRQLNLFGDVFERVRSDYVEKPDDSKLVESAISVTAAPAAAPRRMSEVLRIIREPFRLRQPPTMGLDQRESRPYETRYKAPAVWTLSRG